MSDSLRVMWMRGGTSKGGYVLRDDLPVGRDAALFRMTGSPDPGQIDGMGGGDPLIYKVAVVSVSDQPGVDVNYLFCRCSWIRRLCRTGRTAAISSLVWGRLPSNAGWCLRVRGSRRPRSTWKTPDRLRWRRWRRPAGACAMTGVRGLTACRARRRRCRWNFRTPPGRAGARCCPLGRRATWSTVVAVTMIDNGMPCVLVRAEDLAIAGDEAPADLEGRDGLRARVGCV